MIMTKWRAPDMWDGGECWIIGGGSSMPYEFGVSEDIIKAVIATELKPSAYSSYLSAIHNKHIIGINNAYELGAWVDVCFFGDCTWYAVHRTRLAEFPGIKVTCCPRWKSQKPGTDGLKFLAKDPTHKYGITLNPHRVAWNSNSGAAAISVARHFGVKRIILLGFDMNRGQHNAAHWHNSHGNKRKPPPFRKHLTGWPMIAADAKAMGIEIINASPNSKISEFPKVSVKELLERSSKMRRGTAKPATKKKTATKGPAVDTPPLPIEEPSVEEEQLVVKPPPVESLIEKPTLAEIAVDIDDDAPVQWKKHGKGSLRLGNGQIIKPNQTFEARPSEVPKAFRDTIKRVVTPLKKEAVDTSLRLEYWSEKGDIAYYNVVRGTTNEPVNKKPLPKKEAEELLSNLL